MGIEDCASWYQKKIGTYDKQQWEKTVEQKILDGSKTHVRTKTAKPKTEFIDLDLIRGSSFPKAKPSHGLCVVTRLAIQRFLFFPFYGRWWIRQTSSNIFKLFFILYVIQLIKIGLYTLHWYDVPIKNTESYEAPSPESDMVIPILIMLIMSVIHSLIVSTNSGAEKQSSRSHRMKHVRKFNANGKRSESKKTVTDENKKNTEFPNTKKKSRSYIRKVKLSTTNKPPKPCKRTLDEGFESLNGNGSSENGDEVNSTTNKVADYMGDIKEIVVTSSDKKEEKIEHTYKSTSEEHESDTESEPEVYLRKRNVPKASVSKEESNTDSDTQRTFKSVPSLSSRRGSHAQQCDDSSCFESDGNQEQNEESSPQNENLVSSSEWIGVTTNSEECSYSSESIDTDSEEEMNNNEQTTWDNDCEPTTILSPSCAPSDLVSCTIWENNDMKKADLSVLDISSAIIARVETMPDSLEHFYIGFLFATLLAIMPIVIRITEYVENIVQGEEQLSVMDMSFLIVGKLSSSIIVLINIALSSIVWQRFVMVVALIERFFLAMLFFFQLAVAERTFKQRFLYAKLFSHLTSSRKARKSDLPHFRLNKVRNIKTWLSVRSYLKKRGPQRSVDVIVSAAFIITLLLMSFVSIELVKNSAELNSQYSCEALFWGLCLGYFLLRFMTLGTKINSKYRNLSVLITEQINLYLQIEQKPHKKDELMVANSVLKLATDLLKELESPFKISGLSANPYLYTITKLVILSALSGVFSEMLGFKLKLHKLNIK